MPIPLIHNLHILDIFEGQMIYNISYCYLSDPVLRKWTSVSFSSNYTASIPHLIKNYHMRTVTGLNWNPIFSATILLDGQYQFVRCVRFAEDGPAPDEKREKELK